jgi:hypothetical protein
MGRFRALEVVAVAACVLAGPSARAATHPDFSGTWALPFEVHSSGVPLSSGATPWLPASFGDPHRYHIPTLAELSARVDESVRTHHGNPLYAMPRPLAPPLTAAGKMAAAQLNPALMRHRELNCYPSNVFARVGGGSAVVQIVQGEHSLAIVSEGYVPGRVVYLDAGKHDRVPAQWNGVSTGHWQGSSLEVQTSAIRGDELQGGYPISDQAHLTEVFHLIRGGKTLEVDATFEDPTYYTEPLHKLMYLDAHPDLQLTDYSCEEGKEDMIETAEPSATAPHATAASQATGG